MEAFAYANPTNLTGAVSLLAPKWGETAVLAGGTDLISLMKDHGDTPARIVNIKGIDALRRIEEQNGAYTIGALVSFDDFLAHAAAKNFPALAEAARGVSSPQIRNMGTVGGDLLQRPRCWYYRGGYGLLARDEKGKSLVPNGDNRYHAIFGNEGPAYFVSPSSLAPALVALDAKVTLHGPSGRREIPVDELFITPKAEGEREHSIRPNEILTEISIPSAAREWRNATYEVRQKEALDWPLVTASVALKMDGGKITAARVVLGHVAPVPWRSRAAEQALEGKSLNESSAAEAGEAAVRGARPLSQNAYKVQLARVAVKRALLSVKEGA
ncbi:MAG TPA: xanthine dehydrogenase family protein subunit M [Candidatus Limnocylindrales bacterium]|nr:xanthine dehydrogenase family protein subunit M [Candidatus Limnocylindrales bacterium]